MVVGTGVFLLRDRPDSWISGATPYSESQQVALSPSGCATVTLTGTLRYERAGGAHGSDRRFRAVTVEDPAMAVSTTVSCAAGADAITVTDVRLQQRWSTAEGRPLGRRAATFAGPGQSFTQDGSGLIRATGLTARREVCLRATPTLGLTQGAAPAGPPLRPVQVCER